MICVILSDELGGNLVRGCRRPKKSGANICEHILGVVIPANCFLYLHCNFIYPDCIWSGGRQFIQQGFSQKPQNQ